MKQTLITIECEAPARRPANTHAKFRFNALKLFKSRGAGQEQKSKGKNAAAGNASAISDRECAGY
jgi:hypothetical protein